MLDIHTAIKEDPVRIQIIEDEVSAIIPIKSVFEHLGAETLCSFHISDAVNDFKIYRPNIVVLDWNIGVRKGWEFLDAIEGLGIYSEESRLNLVTYSGEPNLEIELSTFPTIKYLTHIAKPINLPDLTLASASILNIATRD